MQSSCVAVVQIQAERGTHSGRIAYNMTASHARGAATADGSRTNPRQHGRARAGQDRPVQRAGAGSPAHIPSTSCSEGEYDRNGAEEALAFILATSSAAPDAIFPPPQPRPVLVGVPRTNISRCLRWDARVLKFMAHRRFPGASQVGVRSSWWRAAEVASLTLF